jgi:phosphopantothenoylcysteine decarboxylase/phosphopantothenate--cysteine ligase
VLTGRRILLGVTGSIAAYKAVVLLRELIRSGADVEVVLTRGAERFVAPLTFATLSRRPVLTDLFTPDYEQKIGHVAAPARADLLAVAPCTAHAIARFAHGLADDFLANIYLATTGPVLIAPAMDADMFRHAATQANLEVLRRRGVRVVGPASGELASGLRGPGRMAEPAEIVAAIEAILSPRGDLAGERILVTAGPTREPLDPVRCLTNHSSGKMGYAVAQAARERGAEVTLVSGPTALAPPAGVEVARVETAEEMRAAVLERFGWATIVVKAAAVADYRPKETAGTKIKKGEGELTLALEATPDILAELGRRKAGQVLVGFAAETEALVERAAEKLRGKNLDLVVANDVTRPGAGFGADTNVVTLLDRQGRSESLPLLSKRAVAERILDWVLTLKASGRPPAEGGRRTATP